MCKCMCVPQQWPRGHVAMRMLHISWLPRVPIFRYMLPPWPYSIALVLCCLSGILWTLATSDRSICVLQPGLYISVVHELFNPFGCAHKSIWIEFFLTVPGFISWTLSFEPSFRTVVSPFPIFSILDVPPFFCLLRACMLHHLWLRVLFVWFYLLLLLALVIWTVMVYPLVLCLPWCYAWYTLYTLPFIEGVATFS